MPHYSHYLHLTTDSRHVTLKDHWVSADSAEEATDEAERLQAKLKAAHEASGVLSSPPKYMLQLYSRSELGALPVATLSTMPLQMYASLLKSFQ